jgi:hypothetical protein
MTDERLPIKFLQYGRNQKDAETKVDLGKDGTSM